MKISNPNRDRQGTAQDPDPVIASAISRMETEAPTHEADRNDRAGMPDRSRRMPTLGINAGIWVNQEKAVIVRMTDDAEDVQMVRSGASTTPPADSDLIDEARYYEEISARIPNAGTVLIFGPGRTKSRLKAHLKQALPHGSAVVVAPADRMTEQQITGQVRDYFKTQVPLLPLV